MWTAFSKNMLTEALRRAAAGAIAAALACMAATWPAAAQSAPGSEDATPEFRQGVVNQKARTLKPWERELGKFYQRQRLPASPGASVGRTFEQLNRDPLAKINRDPLARLGFGGHVKLPQAPVAPTAPAPAFDPGVARLDTNNDGAVSREEYVRGNDRQFGTGGAGSARQRLYRERLSSQFGNADLNRDGMVSPEELQGIPGTRF
jgi:hypothetical protein